MATRIVLVDDHAIVRQGIARLLGGVDDFEIVGEAASGDEAVSLTGALEPDVVVLDIGLPDVSGIEAARRIREDNANVANVALSAFTDRGRVVEALRAGASAYVVKDCAVEELVEAIRAVASGGR